jgi:hypothetical protein
MRHWVGVLVVLLSLGLATNASGASRVVYGVNDANFSQLWPLMSERMAPLGPIQVGLWVQWHGPRYEPDWVMSGLPQDIGDVPTTQPALVQFLGSPASSPRTRSERRSYGQALLKLVLAHPNIREVQVWNEPDLGFWQGSAGSYVRLLAIVHDALRGTGVKVLGPGFSPWGIVYGRTAKMNVTSFAKAVKAFYRTHPRRRQPLLDGFAYHPYWGFNNATTKATARTLNLLWRHLPQPSPRRGLRFWWTETGFESLINAAPATEFSPGNGYYGNSSLWSQYNSMIGTPNQQAQRVSLVARIARSNPLVAADFNFQLGDDPDLSHWQSGFYFVGGKPKPALLAFRSAIR